MALVQAELSKIIINEKRQDQMIVLKEAKGSRKFPIMIGFLEASSIRMQVARLKAPRPMTHDLILNMIDQLQAVVERLVIDKIIEQTFYAKLVIRRNDGEQVILDVRPSDGIAIAVRARAPIFVDEDVLKSAELPAL